MSKALIVYGTRFGATASTSEEIARVLRQEGMEVKLINAKAERVRDIDAYELIIVGSGIMINRWARAPNKILSRFREQLASKKVALFVCCGSATDDKSKPGEPSGLEVSRKKYLEEKAADYGLKPIAMGLFGGVYNYNKVPWYAKKAMEMDRPRIEAKFKQTEPGVYDTRDWDAIRTWAREVARAM